MPPAVMALPLLPLLLALTGLAHQAADGVVKKGVPFAETVTLFDLQRADEKSRRSERYFPDLSPVDMNCAVPVLASHVQSNAARASDAVRPAHEVLPGTITLRS